MAPRYKLFSAAGEVRSLLRAHDWSACSLGAPEDWPSTLHTTLALVLDSSQPMSLAWGPGLHLFYNDAYAEILGAKHPLALTRPLWEVWPEVEPALHEDMQRALDGHPCFLKSMEFSLLRRGRPEQAWFTFSLTPVRHDDGTVAGVLNTCLDITGEVLAQRGGAQQSQRLHRLFA